jgi:4-amino-4-deoxy-L-arabinose transferase-like glycosyltransferase
MHRLSWLVVPKATAAPEPHLGILLEEAGGSLGATTTTAPARRRENLRIARVTLAFVGLGLLIRLVRFLVVYPIWHDEAFVAVNFLNRGYLDLLRPLDYYQACPILFLWIELTAVRLFGFSESALRLFPVICGLASVLLFRHLAARLLRGIPLLLAVAVFATAFYPIRHSAEVKPYASDLLASLILLALAVEWLRSPEQSRWWWTLSLVVPILLALSYPSVLVATGLVVALAPKVSGCERRSVRRAFLVHVAVVASSFLSLYFSFTVVQSNALQSGYRSGFWRGSFPPWDEPWKLPEWLIGVHVGNTMAYPIGGERGASTATLAALLVGALALWRRRQRTSLFLLLSPFATGLAAAGLGQYPYGGAPRITQYLAPSICLLVGLGAAILLGRLPSRALQRRGLGWAVGLLATLGFFLIGRDLVQPYRVPADVTSRSFAHWLWNESSPDAELLCVKSDLGFAFQPELWKRGMSAVYLFHQGTSTHRDRFKSQIEPRKVLSSGRPVRLVFFDEPPRGNPLFESWLSKICWSYRIGEIREFVVSQGKPYERWLRERYVIWELEPKVSPAEPAAGTALVARPNDTPAAYRSGDNPRNSSGTITE